ncbi:hypothetical protein [Pseudopedobacter beijingensis]|uniref:Lipopolysaccharide assembly protein A domain-containing protein n=1 Tax=Pseudopedobacter beijingensis TaxID=1207056 RepID=A0ABW4IC33_9SPHI
MKFKTFFIIAVTAIITIILMQNQDEVLFKVLWKEMYVSKLIMMLTLTFAGFLIGLIIGRPKKNIDNDTATEDTNSGQITENKPTLSDEDKDYIN